MPDIEQLKAIIKRRRRHINALQQRQDISYYFKELLDILGIQDRRHKYRPSREDLLKMAAQRIEHLRQTIDDIKASKWTPIKPQYNQNNFESNLA